MAELIKIQTQGFLYFRHDLKILRVVNKFLKIIASRSGYYCNGIQSLNWQTSAIPTTDILIYCMLLKAALPHFAQTTPKQAAATLFAVVWAEFGRAIPKRWSIQTSMYNFLNSYFGLSYKSMWKGHCEKVSLFQPSCSSDMSSLVNPSWWFDVSLEIWAVENKW